MNKEKDWSVCRAAIDFNKAGVNMSAYLEVT